MLWVLGRWGPGTKLPTFGRTTYDYRKQTFALPAEGSRRRGSGRRPHDQTGSPADQSCGQRLEQAIVSRGVRLSVFVELTVETGGTMLMGSE